jgi:hypothetical protein
MQDRIGCLDTDGDGWSDDGDVYPNDAARQFVEESSSFPILLGLVGLVIVGLLLIGFTVVSRRGKNNLLTTDFAQKIPVHFNPIGTPTIPAALTVPAAPTAPAVPTTPATPPLPPEGLPPGWTMDQWTWYGADYLKNR